MKIEDILKRQEGKTLEFKRDLSSPQKILKSLVAFANTAGGKLLVGIEDGTRAVLGVRNPLDEEERLCSLVADSIEPRLVPDIELVNWKGRSLLLAEVFPSPLRPHWLKSAGIEGGTFVRVGSTNRQADSLLIREIQREAIGRTFDETPLPDINPEVLDFRVASALFGKVRKLSRNDLETLHLLVKYQSRLVPTVGGVLLFGSNREEKFPDAWIQCGRFAGANKREILDHYDIREHLPTAVENAFDFVKKHSMKSAVFGEVKRRDAWDIPLEAVREAIINAVVHTDYSQIGTPIRISIFDDRLEIQNPGLLTAGLTIDDIMNGVSKLRNRVIGRAFKELGYIEQWGSGVQRMFDVCREEGFRSPIMEEIAINFRVTFPLKKIISPEVDEVDGLILKVIEMKSNSVGASGTDMLEATGLTSRAIRTRLSRLVEAGKIVEISKNKYDPNKKYYPAVKKEGRYG